MRDLAAEDPAETVVAWEAVEELLAVVPESPSKDVLRMVAAGLPADEIAARLGLAVVDVGALAARGRMRVLTAAVAAPQREPGRRRGSGRTSSAAGTGSWSGDR